MINTKENLENEITTINEEFGLEEENGTVTTTSLKVVEVYGKDHKDVMKRLDISSKLYQNLTGEILRSLNIRMEKVKCAQCTVWIAKGLQCLSINLLETKL